MQSQDLILENKLKIKVCVISPLELAFYPAGWGLKSAMNAMNTSSFRS